MTFHVCLCHHVKTIGITQPIEIVVIAVVRGTDRVQIVLFHQCNIFFDRCPGNCLSIERIRIMTVRTFEQKSFSVDGNGLPFRCDHIIIIIYLCPCKFNFSKAQLRRNCLYLFPFSVT